MYRGSQGLLARALRQAVTANHERLRFSSTCPIVNEAAGFVSTPRRSHSSMPEPAAGDLGLRHRYEWMVSRGLLQHDVQQHKVAEMLEDLLREMKEFQKAMDGYQATLSTWTKERHRQKVIILEEQAQIEARKRLHKIARESRGGVWGWWSRKRSRVNAEPGAGRMVARIKREKELDTLVGPRPPPPPSPQGLYLYGNVGCGKTFLMDMFFSASDGVVKCRRRVHFHAAMLEVHDRMHKLWKERRQKWKELKDAKSRLEELREGTSLTLDTAAQEWLEEEQLWETEHESDLSVLYAVADSLFDTGGEDFDGGASLLCFDEVQVVDVFTAVALSAILSRLLSNGTVIVATSNRAPQDLNKDGLQQQIFAAFVASLERHCRSLLVGVDKDYRRAIASSTNNREVPSNYFWPLGHHSQLKLDHLWRDLGSSSTPTSIPVMFGRILEVPECSRGAARFCFQDLCNRPLGAADYVAIAQNYHTLFITDVPIMSMRNSDQARRFITLVDELYNHHCRLIFTAAAPVDDLFMGTDEGPLVDLESLQFETEAEGSRLRRDVLVSGSVSPLAGTKEEKSSIEALLSGREELFAFRRAVSRMIEMDSAVYLAALAHHPKFREGKSSP